MSLSHSANEVLSDEIIEASWTNMFMNFFIGLWN